MPSVPEYLNTITPQQQAQYRHFRQLVKRLAPDASEVISYGIPAFKLGGQPLVYFGAFKNHISVFPASAEMMLAYPELEQYRTSKGTLQFTEAKPLTNELINKIVKYRLAALEGGHD